MHVDLGTLTRVDPGQFGAVGGRDRRADRAVALSYTDVVTQTACWEERSQVCDEIRLALAEVRRRTPSAEPAWGPRGTTPRLTVRGTAAGAPPPPPPPPVWGEWAQELLQCTASLPGAVGSGTFGMHCLTASGPWEVEFVQCAAPLLGVEWAKELLQCSASLPVGSGQWNSCNALPHCLGAVGNASPAMHCHTAWGQWAVELLQCSGTLPGGSG